MIDMERKIEVLTKELSKKCGGQGAELGGVSV